MKTIALGVVLLLGCGPAPCRDEVPPYKLHADCADALHATHGADYDAGYQDAGRPPVAFLLPDGGDARIDAGAP